MRNVPPYPPWTNVDEAEWAEIIDRLTYFARARLSVMSWRGKRGDPAPGGMEPQDFVFAAISKCFTGDRVWMPSKEPSLFRFLASVIKSDINHAAEAAENRLTRRIGADDPASSAREADGPSNLVKLHEVPDRGRGPDNESLERQELEAFFQYVGTEPLLRAAAEIMIFEGLVNPKEISERLCVPVSEANNIKKRIWTKVRSFLIRYKEAKRNLP